MRRRMVCKLRLLQAALATTSLLATSELRAEYRLSPGDTLELSVAGAPDLKFQAPIGVDGATMLPLVGSIPAAGQTISELRRLVQEALGSRVYRRSGDGGREQPIVISPDEITLTIAEYRPVVVTGDVSKPGEQVYRPGMTVRHAVAGSGGYDFVRFRMDNPFLSQADLKSEYEALWIEFAKDQSTVERLKAELKGEGQLEQQSRIETPLSRAITERLASNESEQLSLRNWLHEAETEYLKGTIAKETIRLKLLASEERH